MAIARHGIYPIVLALALAGCASDPELPAFDVACEDPRPEVCTMDYRPVCAVHADGRLATASNACVACSDPSVVGYRAGPCK